MDTLTQLKQALAVLAAMSAQAPGTLAQHQDEIAAQKIIKEQCIDPKEPVATPVSGSKKKGD